MALPITDFVLTGAGKAGVFVQLRDNADPTLIYTAALPTNSLGQVTWSTAPPPPADYSAYTSPLTGSGAVWTLYDPHFRIAYTRGDDAVLASVRISGPGPYFDFLSPDFAGGAKPDGQTVTDGAMTIGSPILTSASGKFTAADVTKRVYVALAGDAGGLIPLVTTIASFQSPNQVTLSANALITVSGKYVLWGTNNDAAIAAAQAKASSAIYLGADFLFSQPGIYVTSLTYKHTKSNWRSRAVPGAFIGFIPAPPFVNSQNDRAVIGAVGTTSAHRPVTGAIAKQATSMVATNAGDVTDLVKGDWLIISEKDVGAGDIVLYEQIQVLSVVGTTVNFQTPIRTAFPATGGGRTLLFRRISGLVEGCELHDIKVLVPDPGGAVNGAPGIQCASVGTRRTKLFGCHVDNVMGQAYYSYQTDDLTLTDCSSSMGGNISPEFAATTGLKIKGGNFGYYASQLNAQTPDGSSALTIDYGSAFWSVIGAEFGPSGTIAIQLTYAYDGVLGFCEVGEIMGAIGVGVTLTGCQRVRVIANGFEGAAGSPSYSMSSQDSVIATTVIVSQDNILAFNSVSGFATPYGPIAPKDLLISSPGVATGHLALSGFLKIGASTDPIQALDVLGNATVSGLLGVGMNPTAGNATLIQLISDSDLFSHILMADSNVARVRTIKMGPGLPGSGVFAIYDSTGGKFLCWMYYSTGNFAAGGHIYPGNVTADGSLQVSGGFLHSTAVPANGSGSNNDWCISDNGHLYFRTGGVWVDAIASATTQSTPANPALTASLVGVMMGLAGTITPVRTGNVLITISGDVFNSVVADGATMQIRTGTGAAPANGAALTGTVRGATPAYTAAVAAAKAPFSITAVVTGLALGTAVWIDLALAAVTGGNASAENITIAAVEV